MTHADAVAADVHAAVVVASLPAASTAASAASDVVGDNVHSPHRSYSICTPFHSSILVDPGTAHSAAAVSAAAIAASATVGGTECSAP